MASRISGLAFCALLLSARHVLGHMQMSWPYPLHSKFDPENTSENIDYSMTSPLEADGSNFPCKGYQNDRPSRVVATYSAGSTYNMSLEGTASHMGGSCQLSMSYDNGATFRVIKSMIGGCPLTSTYDFTIPSYAPSGDALLAWTWQNKVGNREFYMNCAVVNIATSSTYRRRRRQAYNSFESLPFIWKANLPGSSDCVTTEGEDPVYPNPGPDVVHDDGMSSSSPPTTGECDVATPYGPTYQDLGDSSAEPATSSNTNTTTTSGPVGYGTNLTASAPPTDDSHTEHAALSSTTDVSDGSYAASDTSISDANLPDDSYTERRSSTPTATVQARTLSPQAVMAPTSSAAEYDPQRVMLPVSTGVSTTTVYVDCESTITITVTPSATTSHPATYITSVPEAACTGSAAVCPCAAGYGCELVGTCLWQCVAQSVPPSQPPRTSAPSSRMVTSTTRPQPSSTSKPATPSPNPQNPAPSNPDRPPYATGDLSQYLPCVPGTFICTSETTWQTCNYNNDANWVYGYPRTVAAGMMCLPYLSPYSGTTNTYGQQPNAASGKYRDDRIVRERPDGDCDVDGSLQCADGGQQFLVCDHGGWIRMGAVASGTTCTGGEIVAAGLRFGMYSMAFRGDARMMIVKSNVLHDI